MADKRNRTSALLLAGAIAALTIVAATPAAFATNPRTTPGNSTTECSVNWAAAAVLDMNLTNNDPQFPGLMTDFDGNPVDFTNGGYISEVTPAFGDPGILETNHFYVGSGSTLTQVWRIPVATDHPLTDATVTFTAPMELTGTPATIHFNPSSTNTAIHSWGGKYANYTWAEQATTAVDNGDGTWTVALGDMPAGAGTVFQFDISLGNTHLAMDDRFVASATLTGSYLGCNGSVEPAGPAGVPTPPARVETAAK